MNEFFVQSEIEYQSQRRLSAASQHRRARRAARVQTVRQRLTAVVNHLRRPAVELPAPRPAAKHRIESSAARAA